MKSINLDSLFNKKNSDICRMLIFLYENLRIFFMNNID